MHELRDAKDTCDKQELDIRNAVHQACANPIHIIETMAGHSCIRPDHKAVVANLNDGKVSVFLQAIKEELLHKKTEGVELEEDLENAVTGTETSETKFEHELAHFNEAKARGVDLEKCSFECYFVKGSAWGFDVVIEFKPPEDLDPLTVAWIALAPTSLSRTGGDSDRAVVEIRKLIHDSSRAIEINELIKKYEQRVGKPFPN